MFISSSDITGILLPASGSTEEKEAPIWTSDPFRADLTVSRLGGRLLPDWSTKGALSLSAALEMVLPL
jgi:hypothetical protein